MRLHAPPGSGPNHRESPATLFRRFPMSVSPLAGKPAPASLLIDVSKLRDQYYSEHPDSTETSQRVAFGTSGHRGSAARRSFNEDHIVAITRAICDYRKAQGTSGP